MTLKERKLIEKSLNEQLEKMKITEPYHRDMVKQYMKMWDISQSLAKDIKERGVQTLNAAGNYVRNDSVPQLNNTIKQMQLTLDKLHLQAVPVAEEKGADV